MSFINEEGFDIGSTIKDYDSVCATDLIIPYMVYGEQLSELSLATFKNKKRKDVIYSNKYMKKIKYIYSLIKSIQKEERKYFLYYPLVMNLYKTHKLYKEEQKIIIETIDNNSELYEELIDLDFALSEKGCTLQSLQYHEEKDKDLIVAQATNTNADIFAKYDILDCITIRIEHLTDHGSLIILEPINAEYFKRLRELFIFITSLYTITLAGIATIIFNLI